MQALAWNRAEFYRVAQKVSYRTLSISSLNVDQFSQFVRSIDSVRNLLLIGMHTTPAMSLQYTTL